MRKTGDQVHTGIRAEQKHGVAFVKTSSLPVIRADDQLGSRSLIGIESFDVMLLAAV